MATPEDASESAHLILGSPESALCIIPPANVRQDLDRLRSVYDKHYGRWPPHINLIYPFVPAADLPRATSLIRSAFADAQANELHLTLGKADVFSQPHGSTIFVTDDDEVHKQSLSDLHGLITKALGQNTDPPHYHLTIGRSESHDDASRDFLLEKAKLLPPVEWNVQELTVLVRERTYKDGIISNRMKIWETIPLHSSRIFLSKEDLSDEEEMQAENVSDSGKMSQIQQASTYRFSTDANAWTRYEPSISPNTQKDMPSSIRLSSYNVLVNSMHPPARERYPHLVQTLLSTSAQADILVMQEVTDDFLSYLLSNDEIRENYPYTTHGPPQQADIGPMSSLRNIVLLSRWAFGWEYVPFQRRHKGAAVLKFDNIGLTKGPNFYPLVVAGVHFTCGLTDGSVAAKRSQVQTTLGHLSRSYQESPCIIAGDFNIPTSTHTINAACKNHKISSNTEVGIRFMEALFSEADFCDSWTIARVELGDSADRHASKATTNVYEGEEGATFDPSENHLAAETSGSPNNRPQRYDRILLKGQEWWNVSGFNMFGQPDDEDELARCASDHWGIRATFEALLSTSNSRPPLDLASLGPVSVQRDSSALLNNEALHACLQSSQMVPTEDQVSQRKEMFELLESILNTRSGIPLILVAVGSYGLGVWTSSSDIDCMCLGPVSSKTFFALARQRIRKAANLGVRLLRKVDAKTGTMLEIEIRGIRMDLQYCPAARFVESWPESVRRVPSDPIFNLPMQSLRKLKAFRDLDYLQRTIPDLAAFRTAYRFIKLWAQQRGIYSAKFGYLGGVHITLMLSRICKLVAVLRCTAGITAADIVNIFFHHYAKFNWKSDVVFDPFFDKQEPRYHRTAREPMVILGFHTPNFNTVQAASVPSVDTLIEEFKRANSLLSEKTMTWANFLSGNLNAAKDVPQSYQGAHDFLQTYDSYIKIGVNYWGPSLSKGSGLVGWLESKCVLLLVDLNRKLPHIRARIWPARFSSIESADATSDYEGCYLIGLTKAKETNAPPLAIIDRSTSMEALKSTLDRFEEQIRSDERYFDPTSSWVQVSHVKQSKLGELKLDEREWGIYAADDDEDSDSEDEEEDTEDSLTEEIATVSLQGSRTAPIIAAKLRPAPEILSRLRWDPNLDSQDYIVGYEDRFLGAKEMSLERWKTELTDDEFIPQHRILYFKRRSDGTVVWDRKQKIDLLFGSGASALGRGGEKDEE